MGKVCQFILTTCCTERGIATTDVTNAYHHPKGVGLTEIPKTWNRSATEKPHRGKRAVSSGIVIFLKTDAEQNWSDFL